MTVLVGLSWYFTIFRVLFCIKNLDVKIKLLFIATASRHNYLLLIEEEDITVVSFEKNKLGRCFTILTEGDWIRGKERMRAPDTLFLCVLVKGYYTEFLGISGLTRFLFVKLTVAVFCHSKHVILLLFLGIDTTSLICLKFLFSGIISN